MVVCPWPSCRRPVTVTLPSRRYCVSTGKESTRDLTINLHKRLQGVYVSTAVPPAVYSACPSSPCPLPPRVRGHGVVCVQLRAWHSGSAWRVCRVGHAVSATGWLWHLLTVLVASLCAWCDRQFKKKAPRALREIKKFAQVNMFTKDVRIDSNLNKFIWSKGIRNVPYRVRVRLSKKRNDDEEAEEKVSLVAAAAAARSVCLLAHLQQVGV